MKNDFSKEKLKCLLKEVKEFMEIVSVDERIKNQRLMNKYISLFVESLNCFKADEVWRG